MTIKNDPELTPRHPIKCSDYSTENTPKEVICQTIRPINDLSYRSIIDSAEKNCQLINLVINPRQKSLTWS